jgi:hypothetical protein
MNEQTQPTHDATRGALDEAKAHARDVKEQVQEGTREAMRVVAEKAGERADAAIGTMAHEGKALANALRNAADETQRDGARMVSGPLRSLAGLLERWADRTEQAGPQQWFSDLEDFGRREPLALFGVAAAAGFLGTRALRAGAQTRAAGTPHEAVALDTAPARLGSANEVESTEPMAYGQASDEGLSSEGGRS